MSAGLKAIAPCLACALAAFGSSACQDRTPDAPRVQTGGTPTSPRIAPPTFGAPGGGIPGDGNGAEFGDGQNGFDGSAGFSGVGVGGFGGVAGIGGGDFGIAGFGGVAGTSGVGVAGFGGVAGIGGGDFGIAGFGGVAGIGAAGAGAAGAGAAGAGAAGMGGGGDVGNRSPVAAIELDPPCVSDFEALITLVSVSLDPDGDALRCVWNMPAGLPNGAEGCVVSGVVFLDATQSPVQLTVNDGRGGTSTTTRQIGPCTNLAAGQPGAAPPF